MKKMDLYIAVILIVIALGFIPVWPKSVKNGGYIRVNTWTKIMLELHFINID